MRYIINIPIFFSILMATVIDVPGDYSTIQEGIDNSVDGDTVLVQTGEYSGNIDFNGREIILTSTYIWTQDPSTIQNTIIAGDDDGPVVRISNGESDATILTGFTIIDGEQGVRVGNHAIPILTNLIITGNHGDAYGAGICCYTDASIQNVLIYQNSAEKGGGFYSGDANPLLINVTIADNTAEYGGGFYLQKGQPHIINSILWGNSPNQIDYWPYYPEKTVVISYSDIQGGLEGIDINNYCFVDWQDGNIDGNPNFSDIEPNIYDLDFPSPCVHTGHPHLLYNNSDNTRCTMGHTGGGHIIPGFLIYDFGIAGVEHVGSSIQKSWVIHNNRSTSITVESAEVGDDAFLIVTPNFPYTFEPMSTDSITIEFAPDTPTFIESEITLTSSDWNIEFGGESIWLNVSGQGVNATTIGGGLEGNLEVDDYIVIQDIHVNQGNILTIFPGTSIRNYGPYNFLVNGLLNAAGSENQPITFSNYDPETDLSNRWKGLQFISCDDTCRLSYVVISGAYNEFGGGIQCNSTQLLIDNAIIQNNSAYEAGGGLYGNNGSYVKIDQSDFISNTAGNGMGSGYGGGGLAVHNSELILTNTLVSDNTAFGDGATGGGLSLVLSQVDILNTTLSGNMVNSLFTTGGGGLVAYSSNVSLDKTIISGNQVSVYFYGSPGVVAENSTINMIQCTLADNLINSENPDLTGSSMFLNSCYVQIQNSVLWNNQYSEINAVTWQHDPDTLSISYCDIQNGISSIVIEENDLLLWEDGNLNIDPLFNNIEDGDFGLHPDSPCIDTGDPESPLDPDCSVADMGASYFDHCEDTVPGDIIFDGIMDILDLVSIVDCILGTSENQDICLCHDLNDDCILDILDILVLVNLILGI